MQHKPKHYKEAIQNETSRDEASPVFLFAGICLMYVLLHGIFFIVSHPAIRIILCVLASIACIVFLGVWSRRRQYDADAITVFSTRVFPVVFFCAGVAYLLFFPPATVPDESYHYAVSYEYSNVLVPSADIQDMRKDDADFVTDQTLFNTYLTASFWEAQKTGLPVFATSDELVKDEAAQKALRMPGQLNMQTNPPQAKFASACGILLGRMLGLSGVLTFYLGRLFAFLWSFIIIVLAVKLMPIGEKAVMAASLLPMSLHLFGSYSYDSAILAYSFLFTALFLRVVYGEERPSKGLLWGLVVLACVLVPCKLVYYPFCLLALVVPRHRFGSKREMLVWKTCMILIPALILLVGAASRVMRLAGVGQPATAVDNRLGEEGKYYTLNDLIMHPFSSFIMFLRTLYTMGDGYASTLVGGTLGWLQATISARSIQVFILWAVLGLSSLRSAEDDQVLDARIRVCSFIIIAMGSLGVIVSMWLGWTFNTEQVVCGVQGRYFLPYLPLFLLAVRGRVIAAHIDLSQIVVMVLSSFSFLYLAQIAFTVLGA